MRPGNRDHGGGHHGGGHDAWRRLRLRLWRRLWRLLRLRLLCLSDRDRDGHHRRGCGSTEEVVEEYVEVRQRHRRARRRAAPPPPRRPPPGERGCAAAPFPAERRRPAAADRTAGPRPSAGDSFQVSRASASSLSPPGTMISGQGRLPAAVAGEMADQRARARLRPRRPAPERRCRRAPSAARRPP